MKRQLSDGWLIGLAFAAIYLIWGSTYLFNYFAIQSIPPFLMSGSRFLTAGCLLYGFTFWLGAGRPERRHWRSAVRLGFLFLTLGTGGTVWAEQYVDTGIAALLIAFQPLLIVVLMWVLYSKRPGAPVIAGIALGVVGMAVLVGQQRLVTNSQTLLGMLVIGGSMASWAYASVSLSRAELPPNRLQGTAMQMIAGGVLLLLLSLISGEVRYFDPGAITLKGALSWVYLVLFGSLLAFSAFTFLLQRVSPDKVATSNYVNPVVAMFLGWAFNSELITGQSVLAAVLMLTGVFFINSRLRVSGKPPRPSGAPRRGKRLPAGRLPVDKLIPSLRGGNEFTG